MGAGFVIGDRGLAGAGDTHPLWMAAHATVGPCLIVGASAVGQLHLTRELPRDDAFVIRCNGPWLAAAVSDGVGSRPFSRFGSTYVAEALTSLLLRPLSAPVDAARPGAEPLPAPAQDWAPPSSLEEIDLGAPPGKAQQTRRSDRSAARTRRPVRQSANGRPDETFETAFENGGSVGWWARNPTSKGASGEHSDLVSIVREAFAKTHLGLREHASSIGLDLSDLGCTALGLLLNLDSGRCVAGQVGDGALLGLTSEGRMRELVEAPDPGDPQSVYTINRPSFQDHLAIEDLKAADVDPLIAFFVLTDGVSGDLLYSPKVDEVDRWAQTLDHNVRTSASPAEAAAGVLSWLATYKVTGSWDDRTLVVITQRKREDGIRLGSP